MSTIYTARLTLQPFTREQVNAALEGHAALANLLGIAVPADWPQPDFAGVLPLIAALLAQDPATSIWTRLIVHTANRTLVGTIGTHGPPDAGGRVEIGYDILPAYHRQGYAVEAAQAFIAWLSSRADITCITAECHDHNTASIRVLEKVGMRRMATDGAMLRWETPAR